MRFFSKRVSVKFCFLTLLLSLLSSEIALAQKVQRQNGEITRLGIFATTPENRIPSADGVSVCDTAVDGMVWSEIEAALSANQLSSDPSLLHWSTAIIKLPEEAVETLAAIHDPDVAPSPNDPNSHAFNSLTAAQKTALRAKRFPVFIDTSGVGSPAEYNYALGELDLFANQGFIAVAFSGSDDPRPLVGNISRPLRARCLVRWLRRQGYWHNQIMGGTTTGFLLPGAPVPTTPSSKFQGVYLPVDPNRIVIRGQSLGGTTTAGISLVSDAGWDQTLDAVGAFGHDLLHKEEFLRSRPPYSSPAWLQLDGPENTHATFAHLIDPWNPFRSEVNGGIITGSGSDYMVTVTGCQFTNSLVLNNGQLKPEFADIFDFGNLYGLDLGERKCGPFNPAVAENILDVQYPKRDTNGKFLIDFVFDGKPVYKDSDSHIAGDGTWDQWRHAAMPFQGFPSSAKGAYFRLDGSVYKQCLFTLTAEQLALKNSSISSFNSKYIDMSGDVTSAYATYNNSGIPKADAISQATTSLGNIQSSCIFYEDARLKHPGMAESNIVAGKVVPLNGLIVDLDPDVAHIADIMSPIRYANDPAYQIPMMQVQGLQDPWVQPIIGVTSGRLISRIGARKTISLVGPKGHHATSAWVDSFAAFAKVVTHPIYLSTGDFEAAFQAVRDAGPTEGLTILRQPLGFWIDSLHVSAPEFLPYSQYYFCYLLNPGVQDCDIFATNQLIW